MRSSRENNGIVYLVGAGPGDPDLITVKGLKHIMDADVIIHDRLIDSRLLNNAKKGAEIIFVGKFPGKGQALQEHIFDLLIKKARQGNQVVRLKGGDPFVFGRGGEEAQMLKRAGIDYEVIPGISSSIAAAMYAGIPVTHRGVSSSFTVVSGTANQSGTNKDISWDVLAKTNGTLVILMAWNNLNKIVKSLLDAGMRTTTPVAVVQWATKPWQKTITSTLNNIVEQSNKAGFSPPVVVIIGATVKLRKELDWYKPKPLLGKRVLVTRSRSQASTMSKMLSKEGAVPVELPTIVISPPKHYREIDNSIRQIDIYDWVIFTSVNGVKSFFSRVKALKLNSSVMSSVKVAAVGKATAKSLENQNAIVNLIPPQYGSASLVTCMSKMDLRGMKILIPQADIAPSYLPKNLSKLGASVDCKTVYQTKIAIKFRDEIKNVLDSGSIDIATFTSSSTLQNLITILEGDIAPLSKVLIACIGPETARAASKLGLQVDIVPDEPTVKGLVDGLKAHLADTKG